MEGKGIENPSEERKKDDQKWEILDGPSLQASQDSFDDGVLIKQPAKQYEDTIFDIPANNEEERSSRSFPLSSNTNNKRMIKKNNTSKNNHSSKNPSISPAPLSNSSIDQNIKIICNKRVHTNSITGCFLLKNNKDHLSNQQQSYYLATVSLDGELKVHTLVNDQKRSFLKYNNVPTSSTIKMDLFRTQKSNHPRKCLAATSINGHVLFTSGNNDDVIISYGIISACTLSTIYSHRDAVTCLNVLLLDREYTHMLVSGSWDATVKIWGVNITSKENVVLNNEPIAEFYDADDRISCIGSLLFEDGVLISAGCVNGSLFIWLYSWNGGM